MAIFEYVCDGCGKVSEALVYPGDEEPTRCPHCGGRGLTRLISAPSVVKSGSGPQGGRTCCGKTERCDTPPCTRDRTCTRDR